jgi:hypothetical protein
MPRALFQAILLFISPFVGYTIYLLLRHKQPFRGDFWTNRALYSLALGGLLAVVLGIFTLGLFATRHQGAYVPAHIENGKLVPGRIE